MTLDERARLVRELNGVQLRDSVATNLDDYNGRQYDVAP